MIDQHGDGGGRRFYRVGGRKRFYWVKIGTLQMLGCGLVTQARQDCRTSMYSASAICVPKLSTSTQLAS